MAVFEEATVTITKKQYAELIGKAYAYDAYAKIVKTNVKRGGYVSDVERALFVTEEEQE